MFTTLHLQSVFFAFQGGIWKIKALTWESWYFGAKTSLEVKIVNKWYTLHVLQINSTFWRTVEILQSKSTLYLVKLVFKHSHGFADNDIEAYGDKVICPIIQHMANLWIHYSILCLIVYTINNLTFRPPTRPLHICMLNFHDLIFPINFVRFRVIFIKF